MSKDTNISERAKKAYEETYRLIREQQQSEMAYKRKRKNPWLISLIAVTVLGVILIGTPIGLSVSKLLGFEKFESNTSESDNFILSQNQSAIDKDIEVSLNEFYVDANELGLHLQAKLPKNHELLKDNLTTPYMSLTITNENGDNLIESYTGKKWGSLNKESCTLDFFYSLSTVDDNTEILEKFKDSKINIYRIGSRYEVDENKLNKPGLHEEKGESVEGNWSIKVDTSKLKTFDTLTYRPVQEDLLGIYKLLISHTKITVEIADSDWNVGELDNHNLPELVALNENESIEIPFEAHFTEKDEQGEVYHKLVFDYGHYDSYKEFTLTFPNKESIDFK